jgi:integrase
MVSEYIKNGSNAKKNRFTYHFILLTIMPLWGALHIRHSKAMHMLQAGVPLIYIRDFLGHEEISTTEIYARCDGKMKREISIF